MESPDTQPFQSLQATLSAFDNRYSLLYKAAVINDVPARLILQNSSEESLQSYVPLLDALSNTLDQNPSLQSAYETLQPLSLPNLGFSATDFAMTFISLLSLQELDIEERLPEINAFLEKEGLTTLRDMNELFFEHNHWFDGVEKQKVKDADYLNYFVGLQEYYAEVPPLPASDLEFNRVTVKSTPVFLSREESSSFLDGTVITSDLGEEIFDQALVSLQVPVVLFTDHNGKTFSKIWSEFSLKSLLPNDPPFRNSFYLLVWTGLGDEKQTKESFTVARYDLNIRELTVEAPIRLGRDESLIIERIVSSFPIRVPESTVARTGGDFRIYNVNLIQPLFLDMLLRSPLFYPYIYMPEESKASFEKKKFTLHLRTIPLTENPKNMPTETSFSSSVAVTISAYNTTGETMPVKTSRGVEDTNFPSGTPYLICSITRANSSMDAHQFQEIFNRLCRIYLEDVVAEDSILNIYQAMFPEAEYVATVKERKQRKVDSNRRLLQLAQLAPEIFIQGYARKCQGDHQPLIIPDNEIEEWKNKTFEYKGETYQRQILHYPPQNPRYNMVCPSDLYPFPGVKTNGLENKTAYPFIPCCFGSNQMEPGANSFYNQYYRNVEKKTKKPTTRARIITSKIVDFKRSGSLPTPLVSFLNSFFEREIDFVRIGVPRDVNSTISAVLLATQAQDKRLTATSLQRQSVDLRRRFNVTSALLKQELYDLDDQEIQRQLHNPNLFFDPQLFYRALEETLDVNIITFTTKGRDNIPIFEIPRASYYHSRTFRDRPLVLLYKNFGSESDALTYPQVELIGDSASTSYLFSNEVNRKMFASLQAFHNVYIWSPVLGESSGTLSKALPYSDFTEPFAGINGQILDEYGKLRGVTTETGLTVYFAPSQPLNLPVVQGGTNSAADILELFSGTLPDAVSYDGEEIRGFWYSAHGFLYTYFFPLSEPFMPPPNTELHTGPPPPYALERRDLQNYGQLTVMRNMILQLVSWVFLLGKGDARWGVDWFMQNFVSVGNDEKSSYSFSNISRVLPMASSPEEAIDYLSSFPSFVREGRIYLYNARFAAGIRYFLSGIVKGYSGEDLIIPKEIYGITFRNRLQTLLFESWEQLQRWEKEISVSTGLEIRTVLNPNLAREEDPFFYLEEDRLYMVQNTPNLKSALVAADYWRKYNINPGVQDENIRIPYLQYKIGPNGRLLLQEEAPGALVSVLEYEDGSYAALFPLS
ncbi:VETF-like early transcription factor large subunit [Cedratvirus Zaza IHUMI]|uniref:VETF-like early transcription factor large subunit n=1 Tax=Cedratvirus Zaza IHUMI TaxID=2126979 RepID=A0A2R8FCY0_9VIRU|nr:VETF-like early transcription factor large subunit [Cedratvirus Zaza IHUMI]